jgi:hypothetical protein
MNNKLIVGGLAAALLMLSLPVNAHHITGTPGPNATSPHPYTWDFTGTVASPASEPCVPGGPLSALWTAIWTALFALPAPIGPLLLLLFGPQPVCIFAPPLTTGDVLFSVVICEQDDLIGFGTLLGTPLISKIGNNGLCSMAPGYLDADGVLATGDCGFVGRSTGFGPNYDAVADGQAFIAGFPNGPQPDCEKFHNLDGAPADTHGIAVIATAFYTFSMVDIFNNKVAFDANFVSGGACPSDIDTDGAGPDVKTDLISVDLVQAYAASGTDVAGFPHAAPAGGLGTYNVVAGQLEFAVCAAVPGIFN